MTASNKPTTVVLTFHQEDGSWWADSPQMPSLFAGGDDIDTAKELARQVVVEELGNDVLIVDWMPVPAPLERFVTATPASEGGRPGETVRSWPTKEDPSSVGTSFESV